jgi:hypothetical protein
MPGKLAELVDLWKESANSHYVYEWEDIREIREGLAH